MKKERILFLGLLFLLFISQVSALDVATQYSNQTFISKQIAIPEPYSGLISGLFGLPKTALTLQSLIFMVVLFSMFFLVINSVIYLIPFFEGSALRLVISFSITMLVSIGGGLYSSVLGLQNISNLFTFIGDSKGLLFLMPLGLIIFVSIILYFVLKGLKKIISKEQAKDTGFQIGKDIAENKMYSTIFKGRKSI